MLQGADDGPAIVSGAPDKSLLMKAIRYSDANLRMPPRGKLPETVIADFAEWIRRGAPWPAEAKTATAKISEFNLHERRQALVAPAADAAAVAEGQGHRLADLAD